MHIIRVMKISLRRPSQMRIIVLLDAILLIGRGKGKLAKPFSINTDFVDSESLANSSFPVEDN